MGLGVEALEPRVVYEDASLVAVYKPPRMHSVPGLGAGDLCSWAFERYPEAGKAGEGADGAGRSASEGRLLHRLDYETSGIVLFARTPGAFASLIDQQKSGGFYKEYLALSSASRDEYPEGSVPRKAVPSGVDGSLWAEARDRRDEDALAALLGGPRGGARCFVRCAFRSFGPKGSRIACLDPGAGKGRERTIYQSDILGFSLSSDFSRSGGPSALEIRAGISRGFRHQVRAHLAWIGLPIAGDTLYGGRSDRRLRLYAVALSFAHPVTGEAIRLKADP
jgi:23S rRNA pseudouridine1911/1915/1917 synthase